MAQSELDKLLKAFEEKNTSMDYYILMSSEGIPFKTNIENNAQLVKIAGLLLDFILYSKRTLDDLKKTNELGQANKNLTIRMRLKSGEELVIVQEGEFYLITKQICKITEASVEQERKLVNQLFFIINFYFLFILLFIYVIRITQFTLIKRHLLIL